MSTDPGAPLIILALSGGNALGAVQGGVFEAMEQVGLTPHWILGTSVGAINGALIAGNAPERRLARLREFWAAAPGFELAAPPGGLHDLRRLAGAMSAGRSLLFGRHQLFRPRGLWPAGDASGRGASLFERNPLQRTLENLIDLDLLKVGDIRLSINATDIATAEEVIFDTRAEPLGIAHLLASSALLPDFETVEIGGRRYADGSLASNICFGAVEIEALPPQVRCIVVDLFRPEGRPPRSLEAGIALREDLSFAAQVRRTFGEWRRRWDMRGENPGSLQILHLAYRRAGDDLALRTYDFSGQAIRERWQAGYDGATGPLEGLAARKAAPGFHVAHAPLGDP